MAKSNLSRACAAEFVAMTLFVFVGCGTAVSSQAINVFNDTTGTSAAFLIATSLAFGTGIAVLAYTIAPVSGGHINPAVTLSLFILGEVDFSTAVSYIITQFLGAVFGATLVWGSMADQMLLSTQDGNPPFLLGSNFVQAEMPISSAFLIETMGTYLLVWTVCMTAVSKKSIAANIAPIAIGWSVMLAHLVLIPYTGCGINPARSFGPQFVVMMTGVKVGYPGWWIYYTAPFVGGALAALTYKFIFAESDTVDSDDDFALPGEIKTKPQKGKFSSTDMTGEVSSDV